MHARTYTHIQMHINLTCSRSRQPPHARTTHARMHARQSQSPPGPAFQVCLLVELRVIESESDSKPDSENLPVNQSIFAACNWRPGITRQLRETKWAMEPEKRAQPWPTAPAPAGGRPAGANCNLYSLRPFKLAAAAA